MADPKIHPTILDAIQVLGELQSNTATAAQRRDEVIRALACLVIPAQPDAELAAMDPCDRITWKLGAAIAHEQPVDVLKALASFSRVCCDSFNIAHEVFIDLMAGELREVARG